MTGEAIERGDEDTFHLSRRCTNARVHCLFSVLEKNTKLLLQNEKLLADCFSPVRPKCVMHPARSMQ